MQTSVLLELCAYPFGFELEIGPSDEHHRVHGQAFSSLQCAGNRVCGESLQVVHRERRWLDAGFIGRSDEHRRNRNLIGGNDP